MSPAPRNHPDPADTIAAISTPLGEGGIGIVRLSGPQALSLARQVFRPRRPKISWQPHRLYLGHVVDSQGGLLDEVLLTYMPGPRTYTREDVVEINCHSGYQVLSRILDLVLAQGARLARPGEFTLRAFLSGRIDLTQAEAVLEVIQARTAAALQVAAAHLKGGLGRGLTEAREALLELLARVEAALDFPEEAEELAAGEAAGVIAGQEQFLAGLAATYREGRVLKEGLKVVLAGRPNAGKSSLLNRLLDQERAIVTEIPGTTRDVIEEAVVLGGVVVRLSDTAGLGPARDRLEALSIGRTKEQLAQADLVLYLVDGSLPLTPGDREALADLKGRDALVVLNKMDLPLLLLEADLKEAAGLPVLKVSALTGQGLEDLKQAIVDLALGGGLSPAGEMVTQARHHWHLRKCLENLRQARELLAAAPAWELVALELQEAIGELGEITGEAAGGDVLDRIFSQFCLGK
jgi:tRNA modification GTPase